MSKTDKRMHISVSGEKHEALSKRAQELGVSVSYLVEHDVAVLLGDPPPARPNGLKRGRKPNTWRTN